MVPRVPCLGIDGHCGRRDALVLWRTEHGQHDLDRGNAVAGLSSAGEHSDGDFRAQALVAVMRGDAAFVSNTA